MATNTGDAVPVARPAAAADEAVAASLPWIRKSGVRSRGAAARQATATQQQH
jgi:hypothetical protein